MAKVKYGAMVVDSRGSVDGVVYSKNTYGPYVRVKVSPVQPSSSPQLQARASFMDLSKKYSNDLSDAQRVLWKDFAGLYPVSDVFGNSQDLSAIAMFVRVNRILRQCDISPLLDPPANQDVQPLLSAVLSGSSLPNGSSKTVTIAAWSVGLATLTSVAHGLVVGNNVQVAGFVPSGWNGYYSILTKTADTIVFSIPTNPGTATTMGAFAKINSVFSIGFTESPTNPNTVLYVKATPALSPGITFFKPSFRFIGTRGPQGPDKVVSSASWALGVATLTSAAHGLSVGTKIVVSGFTPAFWNGVFIITAIAANTVDYALADDPGAATVLGVFAEATFSASPQDLIVEYLRTHSAITSGKKVACLVATANVLNGALSVGQLSSVILG